MPLGCCGVAGEYADNYSLFLEPHKICVRAIDRLMLIASIKFTIRTHTKFQIFRTTWSRAERSYAYIVQQIRTHEQVQVCHMGHTQAECVQRDLISQSQTHPNTHNLHNEKNGKYVDLDAEPSSWSGMIWVTACYLTHLLATRQKHVHTSSNSETHTLYSLLDIIL